MAQKITLAQGLDMLVRGMAAAVVKALHARDARIDALTTEVAELRAKVDALTAQAQ